MTNVTEAAQTVAHSGSIMALVIVSECFNDYLDKVNYGSWRWPDTSRDPIFTIGRAFILFLCGRTGLFRRG